MSTGKRYGLEERYIEQITRIFAVFPKVKIVYLYGSRARGDFRPDSDIDLAISAPDMDFSEFLLLRSRLGDLPLIFKIDVVHFEKLTEDALKRNILKDAVAFYKKGEQI